MKTLLLAFGIIFTSLLSAQQTETTVRYKDTYVRVFDAAGKKFAKGKITDISNNSLALKDGKTSTEVDMNKVHRIKTKHSAATNVIVGALAGAAIGAIIGVRDAEPDDSWFYYTETEAAIMGASLGGGLGAGIGGLSLLFRKGGTSHIQGSESAWEYFRESMAL